MTIMLTATGRSVDLLHMLPEEVELAHIAHCLARINRFNGLTEYTVAAHCIHVAAILEEQGHGALVQLCGLLHDAHEAYLGDITQPVKQLLSPRLNDWTSLLAATELQLQKVVLRHFGAWTAFAGYHRLVHQADMIALATEKRDLLPASPVEWDCLRGIEPHAWRLDDGRTDWGASTWSTIYTDKVGELIYGLPDAMQQRMRASAVKGALQ